ncbi:MAG: guanylate kinase [Myxococcales bacterium]|nr:guanylate kinase [Myxococcales bacterium]
MALLILAAVSGTGKSTVASALLQRHPERLRLSISHTTRAARPGEVDGVHYHFVDHAKFEGLIKAGGFAEWADYVGHRYGSSRAGIDAAAAVGQDLLFDIEVNGAAQLKASYPDAVSIFLLPPSWDTIVNRLKGRGTDDAAIIARRLKRGREELAAAAAFDFLVVNDDLERAVDEVERIYRTMAARATVRRPLLDAIRLEAAADV